MPGAKAPAAAAAPAGAFTGNQTYGKNIASATTILVRGTGADMSMFRESTWLLKMARIGARYAPYAVPAAAGAAWFVWPALTPAFRKETFGF